MKSGVVSLRKESSILIGDKIDIVRGGCVFMSDVEFSDGRKGIDDALDVNVYVVHGFGIVYILFCYR